NNDEALRVNEQRLRWKEEFLIKFVSLGRVEVWHFDEQTAVSVERAAKARDDVRNFFTLQRNAEESPAILAQDEGVTFCVAYRPENKRFLSGEGGLCVEEIDGSRAREFGKAGEILTQPLVDRIQLRVGFAHFLPQPA